MDKTREVCKSDQIAEYAQRTFLIQDRWAYNFQPTTDIGYCYQGNKCNCTIAYVTVLIAPNTGSKFISGLTFFSQYVMTTFLSECYKYIVNSQLNWWEDGLTDRLILQNHFTIRNFAAWSTLRYLPTTYNIRVGAWYLALVAPSLSIANLPLKS